MSLIFFAATTGGFAANCQPTRADASNDKKRAQLAAVRRLIVAPPFYATDTLAKSSAGTKPGEKPTAASAKTDPRLASYVVQLRELENHARARLPERVGARTPYEIVPADALRTAFETLKLTPESLFQNNGRMRGGRFALPDTANVAKLTAFLKADAILLGAMDEPRRSNGHYYFDVSGINYTSSHVRSKAGYFLLRADGSEILHDYVEALRPLTRIGAREFVTEDWREATDQVIEDLLDEITRYTPVKSGGASALRPVRVVRAMPTRTSAPPSALTGRRISPRNSQP